MDESWRMCMGMSIAHHLPRRKSMENTIFSMSHVSMVGDNSNTLDVDDFSDVFGGPPRSVLCRKFSGDFTRSSSFYQEVFRPPEFVSSHVTKGGRSLPAFRIPARSGEGFYSDIFASDDDIRRSRERSRSNSKVKSNSSSVLSSEELSPHRPVVGDDVGLSSFASKLRPINVPCRWNSTTMMSDQELPKQQQGMAAFAGSRSFYNDNLDMENEYSNGDNLRSSYYGQYCRRATSPEIISLEPHSFRSVKISADDLEFNSPSSPASSLCQEPEPRAGGVRGDSMQEEEEEEEEEDDDDDEDDEAMSSYVIEINSDVREGTGEAVSIDEAIAWAKERYNAETSEREHEKGQRPIETEESSGHFGRQTDGNGITRSSKEEQMKSKSAEEEKERSAEHIKMGLLDEDVRLWSSGKENNIRLLLSTLHHILWLNSGWQMVPLSSLKESSQVKKAYQKARLCLHPDKLQQRGATVSQKYVADKAFSILQDAWAAFISQDVFFS